MQTMFDPTPDHSHSFTLAYLNKSVLLNDWSSIVGELEGCEAVD